MGVACKNTEEGNPQADDTAQWYSIAELVRGTRFVPVPQRRKEKGTLEVELYVCVHPHALSCQHHGSHVESKGHLCGLRFQCPACGSWGPNSGP